MKTLSPAAHPALLLILAGLAAPALAAAQDAATPAAGASTAASDGGSATTDTTGTASAGSGGSSTTASATAHASTEGAAGTASPTHHSPPAGAGVGEEPEAPCTDAPTFDPSTPRFELQFGGGYSALFHTWRQSSDFNVAGRHIDGLYHGPLIRG